MRAVEVDVSYHAFARYVERVKKFPREQISNSREQAIRAEIKSIVRDCARRPSRGDETIVLIVDHLNLNLNHPGRPVIVTVLSGFKRINFGPLLRWHHRVVSVDAATAASETTH